MDRVKRVSSPFSESALAGGNIFSAIFTEEMTTPGVEAHGMICLLFHFQRPDTHKISATGVR
jgi:hypothetical protein